MKDPPPRRSRRPRLDGRRRSGGRGERGVWIRELGRRTTVERNVVYDQSIAAIDDHGIDTVLTAKVCWPGTC